MRYIARLVRQLFLFAATASLFFCILLWVRSFHFREGIYRHRMTNSPSIERSLYVYWFRGDLHFAVDTYDFRAWNKEEEHWQLRRSPRWLKSDEENLIKAYGRGRAGFYYLRWARKSPEDYDFAMVIVPIWALAAITGFLPALMLYRRLKKRRRISAGKCPVCGYDLRATPQRCPECGTLTEMGSKRPSDEEEPLREMET